MKTFTRVTSLSPTDAIQLTRQYLIRGILFLCIGNFISTTANAQATLPALSALPFSFTTYTGTVFPSFLTVGKSSGTGLSTADFTTDAANGGSAAQWRAEGANGISYQGGSGSTTPVGCFQIRVSSTGAIGIQVGWRARTITDNGSIITYSNIDLQWRNGASGAWNTVSGFTFPSLLNNATFTATLPAGANNLADLRIRWVTSDGGYLGLGTARDRVGVDDISICGTPVVSAGNSGPACDGSSVSLSASPSGLTYQWSGPAGFSSSSQNPTVSNLSGLKTGTYFITVTSGACAATGSTVVSDFGSMTPTPTVSPSAVCPGSPVTLSVNSNLTYSNNTSMNIPDGSGGGVMTPVFVSGFSPSTVTTGTLASVTFSISHPFTNDLEVHLIAPNGTDINLADNIGLGANFTNTTVVNAGALNGNFPLLGNPYSGTYNSSTPFAAVNGSAANGTWNLRVIDGSGNFLSGNLVKWTLNLESDGLSYAWSSSPSGFAAGLQTTVDNPLVNTQYSVSTSRNGCTYSSSSPAAVTMLTPQPTVSSNSPVCLGDSMVLLGGNTAAGQSAGNTFAWTGPDGFTSSEQNPRLLATAASAGVYTLTVTNSFSCTESTTHSIALNPLPVVTATSNAPFCSGTQNLILGANAPTGQLFSWSGPGGFTSSDATPTLNNAINTESGNYKVIVTDANGCRDSSVTNVTVWALPPVDVIVIGSAHLCTGQTTDLQAIGAGPSGSYSWSTLENTDLITINTGGTYTVTGTDLHSCTNTDQVVITESAPPAPPIIEATGDVTLCSSDGGSSYSGVTLHTTNYNSDLIWSTGEVGTDIFVDYIDIFNVIYTDAVGCFGVSNSIATSPSFASTDPLDALVSSDAPANTTCAVPVTLTLAEADGSDPLADAYLGSNAQWVWYDEAGCGVNPPLGAGASIVVTPSSIPGPHNYYVRAEGYCNTTNCATITIQVNEPSVAPASALASLSTLCSGDQTTLSVSGGSLGTGANWEWYSGSCGGTPVGSGATINVNTAATTTYFVRAEGDCNVTSCESTTVTVRTYSTDPASASSNAPVNGICIGGNVSLSVAGGSLGDNSTWVWYEGGCANGAAIGTGASITVTPALVGLHTYSVRAEGPCNTTNCATVSVVVNELSVDPLSSSASLSTVCQGNPTMLTVNGGSLGTGANWVLYENGCASGAPIQLSSSRNFTVTPSSPGTHSYYIRAEGMCNSTACTMVNVFVKDSSAQAISLQPSSPNLCEGGQVVMSVNGGHLGSGAVWSWYENTCGNGAPLQTSASTTFSVTPQTPGVHTYMVRAEGDCNSTMCVPVSILVKDSSHVALSAAASISNLCAGDPTQLSVTGGYLGTNASWKWYAGSCGGILTGVGSTVTVNPAASTTYFVRAEGDCNVTACQSTTVTVRTLSTDPVSASSNAPVNGICIGGNVVLSVSGGSLGDNSSWVWYEDGCGNGAPIGTGASITVTPAFEGLHSYYVRAEGPCNTTNCAAVSVLVGTYSVEATSITSSVAGNSICTGNNIVLTLNGGFLGTVATWHWYSGSCAGTPVGTGTSITVAPSSSTTYYVRAEGSCNNTICKSLAVNVSSTPPTGNPPTITTAPNGICSGNGSTVACNAVTGATFYSWSAPNGTTFDGGNPSPYITTSNSVQVTFGNLPNGVSGYDICVFAGNGCGNSVTKCRYIRGRVQTAQTISGNASSCPNTSSVYSIVSLPGADSYTWTVTGAATINGGGTTLTTNSTSVTVNFLAGWTSGTLSVYGSMNCGYNGPTKTITIISTPIMPGVMTGPTLVCPNGVYTYSIAPVAGATGYNWSTNVPGATLAGTGTSRTITFPAVIPAGSTVSVTAQGSCGTSAPRVKSIATGLANAPGTISGPSQGQCGASNVSYSILPVAGATSYLWNATNGATFAGPNNTTAVSVNFPALFSTSNVSVVAINGCGNSAPQTKLVSGAPGSPGVINGVQSVCIGNIYSYTIPGAAGATQYVWSSPPGSIIVSGQNSGTIQVLYDVAASNGNVSVYASNACGNGVPSTPLGISVVCRQAQISQGSLIDAVLYPNPTVGKTTLKFETSSSGDYQISVMDVTGRIMQSQTVTAIEGLNMHELDLSTYAKGLYMIRMERAGEPMQLLRVTVE